MTTTQRTIKTPTKFKTWDTYVTEATQPPFELVISDQETLVVTNPDGAATRSIDTARTSGNVDLMVEGTFGEHADRVLELTAKAPGGVMRALLTDVLTHFKLVALPEDGEGGDQLDETTASH